MSAHTSSDAPVARGDIEQFDRWPGILSLAYGLLAGPLSMLIMQLMSYEAVSWACGQKSLLKVHVIPILFLIFTVIAFILAYRDWLAVGRGDTARNATIVDRTRFLALGGMVSSSFSALLILGMWIPLFVFHPCQW